MPLIHIDLIEGRSDAELKTLLDAAHRAVIAAFGVPIRDRYQIVQQHPRAHMIVEDTGLGLKRSDKVVVVQVTTRPRKKKQKEAPWSRTATRTGPSATAAPSSSPASCEFRIWLATDRRLTQIWSRGESAMAVDDQFKQIAEFVALVIQAGAVLVVTFGAAQALALVAEAIWQREADSPRGREIWLKFATWILLALEFALAADLVRTAVAPTWDDIGKLAVIATIRTMLNYFLAKDIASFDRSKDRDAKHRLARRN